MSRTPATGFSLPDGWSKRQLGVFHRAILKWFDSHQRDLPWRENRDPYRIWVSEVMLQQTTVAAVLRYFDRFIERFPTLSDLAQAELSEVLRLWEGLGYYRRARDLHAAAGWLVAHGYTTLPDQPDVVMQLPGVGRYILGAVLSQAYNRRLPIVEANTLRLIARLWAYEGDPRRGAGQRWLWRAAEALLPPRRVGDFNQALMELGSLVCTPNAPRCSHCPVQSWCAAYRTGRQSEIPPQRQPLKPTPVREVAVVIWNEDKVLLCQRPAGASRWANLWETPHGEIRDQEAPGDAAQRISRTLTGLSVTPGEMLGTISHTVTRWSIELTVIEARWRHGRFRSDFYIQGQWLSRNQLHTMPVSSPQRKLLRFLPSPTG